MKKSLNLPVITRYSNEDPFTGSRVGRSAVNGAQFRGGVRRAGARWRYCGAPGGTGAPARRCTAATHTPHHSPSPCALRYLSTNMLERSISYCPLR